MPKIPYGIQSFERLIQSDYLYVDKTAFIDKLENIGEPYLVFLRPRKFGKTLWLDTLSRYYPEPEPAPYLLRGHPEPVPREIEC